MILKIRDEKYYSSTRKLLEQIKQVVDSYSMPITSRQIFYRLVALNAVKNTKDGYGKVCRICTKGRYTGHLDWDKIVDDTRGSYKTQDWESMEKAIENRINNFRFDRWSDSKYYLEIFVEKRGMVNTLYEITNDLDVHLTACGGFDSTSNIWNSAHRFYKKQNEGKEIKILYFGDFDPSGDYMHEVVKEKLREFGIDVDVKRVCLNFNHVEDYSLPISYEVKVKKSDGRIYDKLEADPRAQSFIAKHGRLMQVEIDALDPSVLAGFVEDSILKYMDESQYLKIVNKENELKKAWLKKINGK